MKNENLQVNTPRSTGRNWYKYFYDETCGWSWSSAYISNRPGSEEGKKLTVRINPNFKDKYLGAVVYGGITVGGDEKTMGIEIYTPLYIKIKTYDTVKIEPSNIIIGGDTIFNIMGNLIQPGNAEYMIGNGGIIRDNKKNIVSDEVMNAEIETYGNSEFGWGFDSWDDYHKEQAVWDNFPWYSTNIDENKTLHIKNGTKVIATGRIHNTNIKGIISGETNAFGVKMRHGGEIKLPNSIIISAPQMTNVSVEYETGECTVTIGAGDAKIIQANGVELTVPSGTVIDNEGNIIK